MFDREVALEALSAICNAQVTSVQAQRSDDGFRFARDAGGGLTAGTRGGILQAAVHPWWSSPGPIQPHSSAEAGQFLSITDFIPLVLTADEPGGACRPLLNAAFPLRDNVDEKQGKLRIDEEKFFDPRFNYDFTKLKDTETYYRGAEVYERPCGWYRLGLKVLNEYGDNTWLGTESRSTESVDGEWPVSYHGTTEEGAGGIIKGHYKAGPRQLFGRGIYSTPHMSVVLKHGYAKTFTSKKTNKTYRVVLQNRINPKYREKCKNGEYWLIPIPKGTSPEEEREIVQNAIRPYGLLLQEV